MPYTEQRVLSVRKWSDKTFSFTTTRPHNFEFENGEFVTIGLRPEGKLIARAYSIVSTNDTDHLEFLSIHVPDGPLTQRLAQIQQGDGVWVNSKATGSLTLKYLQPGRNLYLLSTGTGLAPFVCLIRDPDVYKTYERVVLVHTVRTAHELAYKTEIEALTSERLFYVPTVTRDNFPTSARGSDLFCSGELFNMLGLPTADPADDRVMLCGNPNMNRQMTDYLKQHGWVMTNHSGVGNFTVEKAFVLHND
ncbi:MAG: ferredoxin--NADP reductase [Gammaproteobacteria bacterium]|nr:ferredoxin--NADP reductase [Gammaproteobacteria bacterium]